MRAQPGLKLTLPITSGAKFWINQWVGVEIFCYKIVFLMVPENFVWDRLMFWTQIYEVTSILKLKKRLQFLYLGKIFKKNKITKLKESGFYAKAPTEDMSSYKLPIIKLVDLCNRNIKNHGSYLAYIKLNIKIPETNFALFFPILITWSTTSFLFSVVILITKRIFFQSVIVFFFHIEPISNKIICEPYLGYRG